MNTPTDLVFCIQCTDLDSNKIGSFAYHKDEPFKAVSPVFEDLQGFFNWLHERNYTTGILSDFTVYKVDLAS